MGAIKNLLGSEKGLVGVSLIVGVTVLAALGQVTFIEWQDYTKWIFGIYVAGKTVQGAVSSMADARIAAAATNTSDGPIATTSVVVQPAVTAEPAPTPEPTP